MAKGKKKGPDQSFDLVVPKELTPEMRGGLVWWMQTYQPELLEKLTVKGFVEVCNRVKCVDAYTAARLLEEEGWRPNGELVCILADVTPVNPKGIQKVMRQEWL